jgi:hypothetical protein
LLLLLLLLQDDETVYETFNTKHKRRTMKVRAAPLSHLSRNCQ